MKVYISELTATAMAVIAILGVVLLAVLSKPVPDILLVVTGAAMGFYFGHVNGATAKLSKADAEAKNGIIQTLTEATRHEP